MARLRILDQACYVGGVLSLVLAFGPRIFSGLLCVLPSTKLNIYRIQFELEAGDDEAFCEMPLLNTI